jgi:hypothetical protein
VDNQISRLAAENNTYEATNGADPHRFNQELKPDVCPPRTNRATRDALANHHRRLFNLFRPIECGQIDFIE